MKKCNMCRESKAECEFYGNKKSRDGLAHKCKECSRKSLLLWQQKNREKVRERNRQWQRLNPEKKKASDRNWRANNDKKYREYNKQWEKGNRFLVALQASRYWAKKLGYASCSAIKEDLEAAFTGKCHTCGAAEATLSSRLCVDHDHKTGEFRGWLCRACNLNDVLACV